MGVKRQGAFVAATKELDEREERLKKETDNASDMKNWLLVHATKYLPQQNEKGEFFIPTTAMATDFDVLRSTVHFTLNHVVQSNDGGNWDGLPYIIVMPYTSMTEKNGNPVQVAVKDTWFSPDPDVGIVLPKDARIVRPVNDLPDGQLVAIRGNQVVYKSGNFTPAEEKAILDKMGWHKRQNYEKYLSGNFSDCNICGFENVDLQQMGDVAKKLYENVKDKNAFWRGVFEDKLEMLLAETVRDMAFETCVNDAGGLVWRWGIGDNNPVANKVATLAIEHGIDATACDKGHFNSLEEMFERVWLDFENFLYRGGLRYRSKEGILEKGILTINGDLNAVFDLLQMNADCSAVQSIISALAANKPIDFISEFDSVMQQYGVRNLATEKPALDKTLRRWVLKSANKFAVWRYQIKKLPGYDEFIKRVQGLANGVAVQKLLQGNERDF